MTKPMDLELKKAFSDLHAKMIETKKKIKVIDVELDKLMHSWQCIIMARREITALPTETKTYQSVNRMFLHTSIRDVLYGFNLRDVKIIERIEELQHNKEYLEKNLQESSDNLREMVQQRKELREA